MSRISESTNHKNFSFFSKKLSASSGKSILLRNYNVYPLRARFSFSSPFHSMCSIHELLGIKILLTSTINSTRVVCFCLISSTRYFYYKYFLLSRLVFKNKSLGNRIPIYTPSNPISPMNLWLFERKLHNFMWKFHFIFAYESFLFFRSLVNYFRKFTINFLDSAFDNWKTLFRLVRFAAKQKLRRENARWGLKMKTNFRSRLRARKSEKSVFALLTIREKVVFFVFLFWSRRFARCHHVTTETWAVKVS